MIYGPNVPSVGALRHASIAVLPPAEILGPVSRHSVAEFVALAPALSELVGGPSPFDLAGPSPFGPY